MIPSKKIRKQAKLSVKNSLIHIQDSLRLKKNKVRIRRFELLPCDELIQFVADSGFFADAKEFLRYNRCDGIHSFYHQISARESHYLINYFFDENGRMIKQNIKWVHMIPLLHIFTIKLLMVQ